jgi:hypothetical protein
MEGAVLFKLPKKPLKIVVLPKQLLVVRIRQLLAGSADQSNVRY